MVSTDGVVSYEFCWHYDFQRNLMTVHDDLHLRRSSLIVPSLLFAVCNCKHFSWANGNITRLRTDFFGLTAAFSGSVPKMLFGHCFRKSAHWLLGQRLDADFSWLDGEFPRLWNHYITKNYRWRRNRIVDLQLRLTHQQLEADRFCFPCQAPMFWKSHLLETYGFG